MKRTFKVIKKVVKEIKDHFSESDPVVYSAAIAFFTIFSMPSVLIIIVYSIGSIIGREQINERLIEQVENLIGPASAESVKTIIQNAGIAESGVFATILSIVILLISATAIFNFIQKALNNIWEVKPKPEKGFLKFLQDRVLSFSLIIVLGFLLLVSLAKDAVFNAIKDFINQYVTEFTSYIMIAGNFIVSFGITMLIFALTFKVLPDAKIKWKEVWVGSFATTILFTLGKYVIGIILSNMQVTNTYDAAGSLVGILIWVFYSSIIVLIGGIFTKVYAQQYGRDIEPSKTSVRVERKEIEKST